MVDVTTQTAAQPVMSLDYARPAPQQSHVLLDRIWWMILIGCSFHAATRMSSWLETLILRPAWTFSQGIVWMQIAAPIATGLLFVLLLIFPRKFVLTRAFQSFCILILLGILAAVKVMVIDLGSNLPGRGIVFNALSAIQQFGPYGLWAVPVVGALIYSIEYGSNRASSPVEAPSWNFAILLAISAMLTNGIMHLAFLGDYVSWQSWSLAPGFSRPSSALLALRVLVELGAAASLIWLFFSGSIPVNSRAGISRNILLLATLITLAARWLEIFAQPQRRNLPWTQAYLLEVPHSLVGFGLTLVAVLPALTWPRGTISAE